MFWTDIALGIYAYIYGYDAIYIYAIYAYDAAYIIRLGSLINTKLSSALTVQHAWICIAVTIKGVMTEHAFAI